MSRLLALPALARAAIDTTRRWPAASQQVSRRNAMIACTALASRRAERDEVDDYLRSLRRTTTPTAAAGDTQAGPATAHG